jgi:hypothetical protein
VVYGLLADIVVFVHLAFIAFVLLGGLLVLYRRWFALVHLPAAAWGFFIEASGKLCPLTPLENQLRKRSGSAEYAGDFIERYLLPIIYPAGLTREVQVVLALVVLLVNVLIYGFVVRRSAARRRRLTA